MPTVQPDAAQTARGVPVTIAVLANDAGTGLAVIGYTQPSAGSLVLGADQALTYTPAAGFVGVDGFAYTVRDAQGGTATAEVTVTVALPNAPPLARDDTAQTMAGSGTVIPVIANDNDPDGDALTITGLSMPSFGAVEVTPDQQVRYQPQGGFVGVDSFTYTVADPRGASANAIVTVTVAVPNKAPRAQADRATTPAGEPVTIDVLANDNDPDADPLRITSFTMPAQGHVALDGDGRMVYTPAAGFIGTDRFAYGISDPRGAGATAEVTVDVVRPNQPPVAVPDAASSTGEPVTLNLLANDSDPNGDPLRLVGLSLPAGGEVTPRIDGQVVYTPRAGFSGTDAFTYQVSDGRAVSEAEVRVTVTPPTTPTYANGYRHRRRLVIPAQTTTAETAVDFVLLVRETAPWLKPVTAGGKVEHPQGFDLRFETESGTKLDHEIERYVPADGALVAWVRVPSLHLAAQTRLFLYYGKAGLAGSEASPTATWRGYLAVLDARTGTDRTAAGRSLTPSGIGTGELIGGAGAYTGSSVATRADAAFLSGLGALTVQALVLPNAATVGSSRGILAQGPMNGSDASAGLALQYVANEPDARNAIQFRLACSDGATFVTSAADAQAARRQLLHGVWRRDEPARLFLDGAEVATSNTGQRRSGLTAMATGGLFLGAGARDPASGGWSGLIDEVRFAAAAFTPARIAAEAANLGTVQALYGLGGEDTAGEANAAPTAVPRRAQAAAGSSVDIDVIAAAYDPDGPAPQIVGVGTPAHGVASVVSGRVRYTPVAGHVGVDQFAYTLESGGKRSTSIVQVEVQAEFPAPLRSVTVATADELREALAGSSSLGPLLPGDHIRCQPGTYAGTFTLSRAGTPANPIFITRAGSTGTVTISGRINLNGAWTGVHRLRFTGNGLKVNPTARGARVTRCLFDGINYDGMIYFTGNNHPEVRVDHNEFRNITGSAVRCELQSGTNNRGMRIDHNYFNGHTVIPSNESILTILTDAFRDAFLSYDHNLFLNCMRDPNNVNNQNEIITVKTAAARIRNNTFINCNAGFVSLRETNRCLVEGNWFENGSFIKAHGDDHVIRNNRATGKVLELNAGNAWADDGSPTVWPSACNGCGKRGRTVLITGGSDPCGCKPAHAASRNNTVENNVGVINIGTREGTGGTARAATGHTLRNNSQAASLISGNTASISQSGIGQQVNTAQKLTTAMVGPDAA